ncbi:MAG: ATP-binding protein [Candidatus Micrarchaeota archaeon]
MTNPYDPQSPAKPDFFGGRKHILETVKERIEKAREQRQSGGVLVYGYRGVGKTSVLNKIRSMVTPEEGQPLNNILVLYRRLGKTTSDAELYQIIVESLLEGIEQRKTALDKLTGLPDKIKSAKIFNIEFAINDDWKQKTPFLKWRQLAENLENVELIIIEIDDADHLSPEALGELKTIVEEQNETPVVLVVSGGYEFESRLVEDYSPIARIFSGASFNLGEFNVEETREVLEKPLRDGTTLWEESGIHAVQKLSGGYPYLVQCIASASYAEGTRIGAERVEKSTNAALEIGKPWLSHELENASDNDIISFLKIVKSNKSPIKSSEMSRLGVSPPYVGRLVKLNVLKQVSRGRYIIKKPPIIAYYHALLRKVTTETLGELQK